MERFLKSKEYKRQKAIYEKNYFKIGGDYAMYDGDKLTMMSTAKIAEYFKNKKVEIQSVKETDDGETVVEKKKKSFYQVWSEDPKMKEYKEVVFNCNTEQVKDSQFNLFDGFAIHDHIIEDKKKAMAGLKRIKKHISILCNHDPNGIKVVTFYYAQALKYPHLLPNFCLVFISKEGVGKDMFADFIENVFGEKYCFNIDKMEQLLGKFNAVHSGKIFGVINETNPVDSVQRRDNIKYVVTAKKVQIEGKHKDPVKAPNYCRITFFANRLTAFPLEGEARRPYIQYCSSEMLPKYIGAEKSKEYFDNLSDVIADRDVQKAFYDYLLKFDVDGFNFKEMEKSKLHLQLEDATKPPLVAFFQELVSVAVIKTIKLKTTELLQMYNEFMKKRNMKFDVNQKSFTTEVMHDFQIKKYVSCGVEKYKIEVEDLKKLLITEYKCNFDVNEDEDDDKDIPIVPEVTKEQSDIIANWAIKYAELEAKYNDLLNERKYIPPYWVEKAVSQDVFKKTKPVEVEEDETPVKVKKTKKTKETKKPEPVESDDDEDDFTQDNLENFASGFV